MSFQIDLEVAAPYPGLRPFRREEAQVFFGRDAQIDDVLGRLKKNKFLGVVGSSGCGKSSLIRAGILPALESGLMGEIGSTWFVVDLKPGDAPITNLAKALVNSKVFGDRWTDSPESIALLTATLRRSDVALVNLVKELQLPQFSNILILADQFEEIFRFQQRDPNEALAFVNLLLSTAMDRSVPTYVVVTMRTDFLGECATFPGLPEALNDSQYLCPRMTRDQLAEAIEGPASVFGATVERGLITQLINDAGSNSDQLPLVQHVLARMWNQQSSPHTTQLREGEAPAEPLLLREGEAPAEPLLLREGEAPAEPLRHSMSTLSPGSAEASPSRLTDVVTNGLLTLANYFQSGGLFCLSALQSESRSAFSSGGENEYAPAILQNALSRHVDEAYYELADPAQAASMADGADHKPSPSQWVAQMLFRSLAEHSVSGQLVRRPVKLRAVAEIVREPTESLDAAIDRVKSVVEVFRREDRSFLVPPSGFALSGESVLDISHEALIRQWRRLAGEGDETTDGVGSNVGWLPLEERARRRYRRLAEAAEAEATSGLMYDPELSFLNAWWEQFQPRRAWGNGVIPGSFDLTEIYLRKSLRAAEEETKKERLAAEQLLTLQQDKIRSTRRLLKIAGAIAAVALMFAFIARRAQVTAVQAQSAAITAQGRAVTNAQKAEREKVRAEAALVRSEHLVYASQVRTAERELELSNGDFEVALQSLDACRWDYRGWEHDYLYSSNFRLLGHSAQVTSVSFSPDGTRIVSGSEDKTLKLWDAETGAELRTLTGHSGDVTSVSFRFDGKRIVSGSEDTTLKLWDAETGAELRTLDGHLSDVKCVSFSPDGKWIVSGSADTTLKLWDAETGAELRTLDGHSSYVSSVSFSPDGKWIVSGSADATLKLWDAEKEAEPRTLTGHSGNITSVSFRFDSKRIVSGSADNTLKVWDAEEAKELRTLTGHSVTSVNFSSDGKWIVSGSADKTLKLWDAEREAEPRTLTGHSGYVSSVSFSPDGRRIVSGSWDRSVKLWDAETGVEPRTLKGNFKFTSVSFSPDSKRIVSGSGNGELKQWNAETGEELRTLTGHDGEVTCVSFISPDGTRIVSGSADNTLKVWDAEEGAELRTLTGHSGSVRSVSFSPDGKRIVSGSADKTLKVWDAEEGAELRTLTGHSGSVRSVSFSPDGKRIVSGSADKTLKLWDPETGAEPRTLTGHSADVTSVSFSPDSKRIVSGSADKTLKLWDAKTGAELRTLTGHSADVNSVSFSPDGKRIVSGSKDNTLKVWDAETGAELRKLTEHKLPVTSVSFSPDGKRIVSGSGSELKLWDAKRRRAMLPILVTTGSGEVPRAVASHDDTWIVAGDNKGALQVFSARSGQSQLDLSGHRNGIVALAVHPDMTQVASASSDDNVIFWDLQPDKTGPTLVKQKIVPPKGDEMPWRMAYSSDGSSLAMGTREGTVRIWDSKKEAERQPIVTKGSYVKGLEFINGNSQLLTMGLAKGGESSEIKIWDVKSGALMRTVGTIPGEWTAGFARHGNLIASGSESGQLKVWDLATGNELFSLDNAHLKDIRGISFSPDGSLLATGSWDNMAKIWTVESLSDGTLSVKQAIELTEHTAPVTSVTFSHNGTRLVSAGKDGYVRVWLLEELMPRHFRDKTVLTSVSPDSPIVVTNPVAERERPTLQTPTGVSTWSSVLFFGLVICVAIIAISAQRRRKNG